MLRLKAQNQPSRRRRRGGRKPTKASGFSDKYETIYRSPDPFPPRMDREMTWCQSISLSAAGAGGSEVLGTEFSFRLNSLNQPIITGGGTHKPYGFDQMQPLYDRYIVHATEVALMFQVPASAGYNLALAASTSPSSGAYSLTGRAVSDIMESTQGFAMLLDATGLTDYKKYSFPLHQIEGLTKLQWDDELDDYSGSTASGNPSKSPVLNIALSNTLNTTAVTLSVFVLLRFRATFYGRTIQAPS